jgi:hypothetical protein
MAITQNQYLRNNMLKYESLNEIISQRVPLRQEVPKDNAMLRLHSDCQKDQT